MFDEARAFSKKYKLSHDEVTLEEARELINACQLRGTWNSYQDRNVRWPKLATILDFYSP